MSESAALSSTSAAIGAGDIATHRAELFLEEKAADAGDMALYQWLGLVATIL